MRELGTRLRSASLMCWQAGRSLTVAQSAITLLTGMLATVVAWSTKLMIDAVVSRTDESVLALSVAALAAAGLLGACAPLLSDYLRGELGRRVSLIMNDRLFAAVGGFQGLQRFEEPRVLDRLRAAQQSTTNAIEPATLGLFSSAKDLISLVGLLITLYLLAPPMALIVIISAIPVLFAQLSLSRRFARMLDTVSTASRRGFQLSMLNNDVRAVKEIRLLGLVDFFKHRVLDTVRTANSAQRDLDRRQLRTQSLLSLLSATIATGGMIWAVHTAFQGRLTTGDVAAFLAAVTAAQAAVSGLVSRLTSAHRALITLGYYLDVVALPPDLPTAGEPRALPELSGRIDLDDVWFRYDEAQPWVLRGVTLRIGRGETLALVGLNGAGKSTLIKLLCRFYDPDRGSIRWDGVDIRAVPVTELRQRLGVLFQDFMEYDLTAEENIGIGDLPAIADRSRIRWAADSAGVGDTIDSLPRGYQTMLSRIFFKESDKNDPETGVMLSGGQWQRVALARTLMRAHRDLLILDEPSAGLDAEAEQQIHEQLRTHRGASTSILVSHRLSTVRDANRIVILAEGRIVEEGTHQELIDLDGRYAHLFNLQARGYQSADTR